ncbi:MAG: hypothetical protein R3E44_05975 [Paracoccaceae bacterium]
MSKTYLVGFVVVTGLAAGAVDYVNQARRAGSTPGTYAVSDYAGSISTRFTETRDAAAAETQRRALRAMAIRDLLPDAPEGWTRRDWDAAAEARLDKRYDMQKDASVPDEFKNDPMMKMLAGASDAARAQADAAEVYVYERDDELIALRLERRSADAMGGIAGIGMQVVAANLNAMSSSAGYAYVGGVAFGENQGMFGQESARSYQKLTGKVGNELTITVRAQASEEAIMSLLTAIDYDRLNAMLDHPVPGVGNDAPVLDKEAARAMAEAQLRAEDEAMRQAGQDAEARLQSIAGKMRDDETGMATIGAVVGLVDGDSVTVPDGAEESAAPAKKGGLFAALTGMFTGGGDEKPAVNDAVSSDGGGEVKVNKSIGSGNCASDKGFKRCSIGGN